MQMRKLGPYEVTAIGYGCMNLSHAYGPPQPREVAERIIRRALDLGVTHFDTAALYGFGANEQLIGSLLANRPDYVIVASKCGLFGRDGKRVIDGRPESIRKICEQSLRNLKTDRIDLYYLHRWDRSVPLEDSVAALADLKRQGKIRAIGLSEVGATSLRKAHAVHPIAALQSEYSLWTRNPEIAVLEECRQLGVTLVAFSPLGRGFLAGACVRRRSGRWRHPPHHAALPESQLRGKPAALDRSRPSPPKWAAAARNWRWPGCSPGPARVVIPGTTREAHLVENCGADAIRLDAATIAALDAVSLRGRPQGPVIHLRRRSKMTPKSLVKSPETL
jgi:aryl-alcohol dehydrogenase-like predicted oxidoreductase